MIILAYIFFSTKGIQFALGVHQGCFRKEISEHVFLCLKVLLYYDLDFLNSLEHVQIFALHSTSVILYSLHMYTLIQLNHFPHILNIPESNTIFFEG